MDQLKTSLISVSLKCGLDITQDQANVLISTISFSLKVVVHKKKPHVPFVPYTPSYHMRKSAPKEISS